MKLIWLQLREVTKNWKNAATGMVRGQSQFAVVFGSASGFLECIVSGLAHQPCNSVGAATKHSTAAIRSKTSSMCVSF